MARKFHHHFVTHAHSGVQNRAHLISITALFVYLQVLAVFGFGLFLIRGTTAQILGAVSFEKGQIIELTNSRRAENGLSALVENSQLDQAAQAKASDMFAHDYWAHYSPQGKTPWQFINAAGYKYTFAGENLARDFSDPESVVNAWMNSPSHRSNLLDRNFREIGVAVEKGELAGREGTLVVQMFAANPQSPVGKKVDGSRLTVNSQPQTSQVAGEQESRNMIYDASSFFQKVRFMTGDFGLVKSITLGLTAFMFLLFVIELSVSLKKAHFKLQSAVLAHMMLLGFVMLVLWYSTAGAIK